MFMDNVAECWLGDTKRGSEKKKILIIRLYFDYVVDLNITRKAS